MSSTITPSSTENLRDNVSRIVAAAIAVGNVKPEEIPNLIRSVAATFKDLEGKESTPTKDAEPATLAPAVPIKKSITPDYLVCLEDGKKLKMLKRHLATAYGMTPDQYRAKWGLPANYPMTAPNYSSHRSTLAKTIGLGRASK